MSFTLAVGTRLRDRYIIKKVLVDHGANRWYLARDAKISDNDVMVLEFGFPAELEDVLQHRRDEYAQAVAGIEEFQHPHLARQLDHFEEARQEYVIIEHVEGVTLQIMKKMMIRSLPEKQILTWAAQVCEALQYLHGRPRPYIMGRLDLNHVMLTSDESIKLIDFGLHRFFKPGTLLPVFADNPEKRYVDYTKLGKLLQELMMGGAVVDFDADAPKVYNPELVKLVNHLLTEESSHTYQSFAEVGAHLKEFINPLEASAGKEAASPSGPRKNSGVLSGALSGPLEGPAPGRILALMARMPVRFLFVGLAIIILGPLIALVVTAQSSNYTKNGPITYVLCNGDELFGVDSRDMKVKDHLPLRDSVITASATTRDGFQLLLLDGRNGRILVLDTATDQLKLQVSVYQQPRAMVMDKNGLTLYCIHNQSRTISMVDLTTWQMSKLLAVPYAPTSLAVTPDGSTLYASVEKENKVYAVDVATGKILNEFQLDGGPSVLLVSSDGHELWVVGKLSESISVLDISGTPGTTPTLKQTIPSIKGHGPVAMQYSQDGVLMYILCQGSSTITAVKPTDYTVSGTMPTGGDGPTSWSFPANSNQVWVANSASGTVTQIDLSSQTVLQTSRVGVNPSLVEAVP